MDYSPYYFENCINKDIGLKPVYGATGLGKTFGIKQCIKKVLSYNPTQKFIYITNRHGLIQELYTDLLKIGKEHGFKAAYLKAKIDSLKDLFNQNLLYDTLKNLVNKKFFKYDEIFNDEDIAIQHFKKQISLLKNYTFNLNDSQTPNLLKNEIDKVFIEIHKLLVKQFFLIKRRHPKFHKKMLLDADIWAVFPFIKFENDPNTNVLLGTIHKFSLGFFNGRRNIKLHDLENGKEKEPYIIFLDEFDFLENEILNILCREPQLNNAIEFVRLFMEDFENWQEIEFWEKNDNLKFVKKQMAEICDFIKKQSRKNKLNFPEYRRFTFDNQEFAEGKKQKFILFQNKNTISSDAFFLEKDKQKRYKIVTQKSELTINAFALFNMIKEATERLMKIFDKIKETHFAFDSIIQYLWNEKNDNIQGAYYRYISKNFSYRYIRKQNRISIANNNESQKDAFGYDHGFWLMTIKKTNDLDSELAEIEQLELITSPESIISQLASKNLVFGLSATADIEERVVNSFNMAWFKNNVNFIEPNQKDIELVEALKKEKHLARLGVLSNKQIEDIQKIQQLELFKKELSKFKLPEGQKLVKFIPNEKINSTHPFYRIIKQLKKTGFYTEDGEGIQSKARDFRMTANLRFFGCLNWILNKSQNRSHLIFSNTFKRELLFFDEKKQSTLSYSFPAQVRKQLTQIGFHVEKLKLGYRLKFQEKSINLIFLDANKNKELGESFLRNNKFNPAYDDLFLDKTAEKVILVTQYATASNGLNLRCLNIDGQETDFQGIHLLEQRYFWFDTSQESKEESLNNKKKAFWYLWKLYKEKEIGLWRFRSFLKKTHLKEFNNFYKTTREHTLSQMALFYQALGRVDRKKKVMPSIEVSLGEDVKNLFIDFLTQPMYDDLRKKRQKYTSHFMLELNKEILNFYKKQQIRAELSQPQDISQENIVSKEKIKGILDEIKKINKNQYSVENAKSVRKGWADIREYVLKQDFQAQVFINDRTIDFQDLTFKTSLLQENNKIFLSTTNFKIYPKKFKIEEGIIEWDLNTPFYYINKNAFLKQEFKNLGYALDFQRQPYQTQKIFTPYIEQAILKGAIGEEAIKLLLEAKFLYCEADRYLPINLFEEFDAKLKNKPIYFDFKNYSLTTQSLFELEKGDYFYEEDFDSFEFIKKTQNKLKRIKKITGEKEAKYIVVNFVSKQDKKTKYFDNKLNEAKYFEDCSLAVVPSSITIEEPNQLSVEFEKLVHSLQNL